MAKKYYIVVSHPETDDKYFVRFNGFAAPTFSATKDNVRIYDDDKTAYSDAVKLDEKIKKERGGEQCSVSVTLFRDLNSQCTTEETVGKESGWIHKFRFEFESLSFRNLWVRFNKKTGYVQGAITGDNTGAVYELEDYYYDVVCAFLNMASDELEGTLCKETSWVKKFRYGNRNLKPRNLWIRFNADAGNMQASITGDNPEEIYEISGNYKEVVSTYFNWVKKSVTKGLLQYENEQRANLPDMRP